MGKRLGKDILFVKMSPIDDIRSKVTNNEFEFTIHAVDCSPETGEQFFAPRTVERLQSIVWDNLKPKRFIQASVHEFAANN